MTPWWTEKQGECASRILLALERDGPLSTTEILDHPLLYPFKSDRVVRRCLTALHKRGTIVGCGGGGIEYMWSLETQGWTDQFVR